MPGVYEEYAGAIADLPHGEYLQIFARKNIEAASALHHEKLWSEYLEKTHFKTGSLFAHLLAGTALIAEMPRAQAPLLAELAVNLGLSFQVADDLKDLTLSTEALTKDSLNDLRERNTTAPYLYALFRLEASGKTAQASRFLSILQKRHKSDDDVRFVYEKCQETDALASTRRLIRWHYSQAQSAFRRLAGEGAEMYLPVLADYCGPILNV